MTDLTDHHTECDECGDPIDYCIGHERHPLAYRSDISDWWCGRCQTVSDFCHQINPY